MFLYNIAFSLEFIVIALGAFLIGWSRYKCEKNKFLWENRPVPGVVETSRAETSRAYPSPRTCGTGFTQAVGIILIILALLNFADTIVNCVRYHHRLFSFKQKIETMKQNQNQNNSDNYSTPENP